MSKLVLLVTLIEAFLPADGAFSMIIAAGPSETPQGFQDCQGRQKRGGWGGPSRHTFRGKICHYSKSS